MRAFLLIVILSAIAIAPVWAQYGVLEIGVGNNEGRAGKHNERFRDLGLQGYIEGRLHFNDAWAGSIQLMGGKAKNRLDGYETSQILATLYCDYSYRTQNITFFAGLGLGIGYIDDETLPLYHDYSDDEWSDNETAAFNQFLFSPRAGIELWDRLRLSVDWRFMSRKEYSTMGLNIGFMFGKRWRVRDEWL